MSPEEFRAIRDRAGLTQEQMAERLGYAPGASGRVQVARMEAGDRTITTRTARLVAAIGESATQTPTETE